MLPVDSPHGKYDYELGAQRIKECNEGRYTYIVEENGIKATHLIGTAFVTSNVVLERKLLILKDERLESSVHYLPKETTVEYAKNNLHKHGSQDLEKVLTATKTRCLDANIRFHFESYANLFKVILRRPNKRLKIEDEVD